MSARPIAVRFGLRLGVRRDFQSVGIDGHMDKGGLGDESTHFVLTKFEVARILGMRSLVLSEGASSMVVLQDRRLRENVLYVAALEMQRGLLRAKVVRGGVERDVCDAKLPPTLPTYLASFERA